MKTSKSIVLVLTLVALAWPAGARATASRRDRFRHDGRLRDEDSAALDVARRSIDAVGKEDGAKKAKKTGGKKK